MVKFTLLFLLAVASVGSAQQQVDESEKSADGVCSGITADSNALNSEFDLPYQPQSPRNQGVLSTAPPSDLKIPKAVWAAGGQMPLRSNVSLKPFRWTAPGVAHRRLIFEEPLLERHGYNRGHLFQPVVSGARFFWRSTLLPLTAIKGHHRCCDSGLGWGAPDADPCPTCYR